ncbi:hypothetical protein ABB37_00168 [Leptomonas pyrrhocoris]|uniref:RanBP2-type domain-containing protein n=1 Tax=Leptomonas pyrrhocoris TaxID=157538 RepID=A0A0M9G9U7_LEPPY|nr:hypothetical protein ABB37_00168 [Leptomonas pyrrhocoris]KPA85830.1 hypothetical protein ABB37_00168 [Leptomonas pyrrhocoris]|eukprot:XP_015664269.1 hypothetical protein ABB37_00168 [Leptomonas pyrrhocoris]
MWIRSPLTRSTPPRHFFLRLRQQRVPSSSKLPPSLPSSSDDTADRFLLTRELVDDVHVTVSPSARRGSDGAAVLWLPFQSLTLTYAAHPALRSLAASHTLILESLAKTPDVLQQLTVWNPCGGSMAATRLRCVTAAFAMVEPYRRSVSRMLALPPQQRRLVDEIRLVQLLFFPSPNASLLVSRELERMRDGCTGDVLWTLLSVPCSPEVLRVVLVAALRSCPAGLTPQVFQRAVHALLNNDNFFCERTFDDLHRLLVSVVLPAVGVGRSDSGVNAAGAGPALDVLAVRWTPLMKKWARVYTKSVKGFLLYDCLCALMRAAPSAETKLPSSFYVQLLGALLDASVAGGADKAREGWAKMTRVAADALRLFGRNAADLRAIWVLLLKAALTLPPRHEDYQRLLEAYHLCGRCGHTVPLDRQGFLQVTRLVSGAIGAGPPAHAVHQFCTFLYEQDNVNFLWLLDGIGTTLTDLWEMHGATATGAAQELLTALEKLLRDRRVTGVDIHANPVVARALHRFKLGGPILFWWACGCGEELPCSSKRCTACLRSSGVSWKCAACGQEHKVPCGVQSCSCGQPNPRLAAATRAGHSLCGACGDVKDTRGVCVRCAVQRGAQSRTMECPHCHKTYAPNALHCPHCYAANPIKPPLYLWHCEACDDFNYSIWSSCRTCKVPRRGGAFFMPFVPWACGCGALNHAGRLTCGGCGTGVRHGGFTCAGCHAHVSSKSLRRVVLTVDSKAIAVHLCPHCQTPHPRSDLLLYSPLLPRHCMFCAKTIHPTSVSPRGAFHHCGAVQGVNENYVFRCLHCAAAGHPQQGELQTGFHCRHCLFPRPEVEALMVAAEADAAPVTAVWRCLHESEDGALCGQWNYGWSAHCVTCGTGRPDSSFECRAKARLWRCGTCGHANRPIDVLFCPHCKSGLQPVQPCVTCGMPHLSYSCRVNMQQCE